MSVTYGFFNSLDGDRAYNADQMSKYFDGLVSNGVYESVGGALQVLASSGMNVNVQTGRAIIDCKWFNSDAVETLAITAASPALNRYTAVVIRLDMTNRLMELDTVDGTAASTPSYPALTNTSQIKEICLAMIYVAAGATAISQANITDMRASSLCGWVTGIVQQVDTSTLFLQWQTAYQAYYDAMTQQFQDWFNNLTQQLNVNTFVNAFKKHAVMDGSATSVTLNMTGYTYDPSDIIIVYINGLYEVEGTDYTLNTSVDPVAIVPVPTVAGTEIDIVIYRSQIGFYVVAASPTEALGTENEGEGISA